MLEAVWAAVPQGGRERILLRACIQIANTNLKLRMNKPHAAARQPDMKKNADLGI